MINDMKELKRLRNFIFFDKGIGSEEGKRCRKCWNNPEEYKCNDYDICEKYTPNYVFWSEETIKLVEELFDTIEYLLEKQIPQKICVFDYGKAHCPNCKKDIHGMGKIKFCFDCGQKIEWL